MDPFSCSTFSLSLKLPFTNGEITFRFGAATRFKGKSHEVWGGFIGCRFLGGFMCRLCFGRRRQAAFFFSFSKVTGLEGWKVETRPACPSWCLGAKLGARQVVTCRSCSVRKSMASVPVLFSLVQFPGDIKWVALGRLLQSTRTLSICFPKRTPMLMTGRLFRGLGLRGWPLQPEFGPFW